MNLVVAYNQASLWVRIPPVLRAFVVTIGRAAVLCAVILISGMQDGYLLGCGFESHRRSLLYGFIYGVVAKWSNAADCKSVPVGFSGSNPFHLTIIFFTVFFHLVLFLFYGFFLSICSVFAEDVALGEHCEEMLSEVVVASLRTVDGREYHLTLYKEVVGCIYGYECLKYYLTLSEEVALGELSLLSATNIADSMPPLCYIVAYCMRNICCI